MGYRKWISLDFHTLRRITWMDNIKMDLRETGWGGMDWIDLVQDRDQWRTLVNTVMNHKFSRRAHLHGVS
jgi:hypothetical protein